MIPTMLGSLSKRHGASNRHICYPQSGRSGSWKLSRQKIHRLQTLIGGGRGNGSWSRSRNSGYPPVSFKHFSLSTLNFLLHSTSSILARILQQDTTPLKHHSYSDHRQAVINVLWQKKKKTDKKSIHKVKKRWQNFGGTVF